LMCERIDESAPEVTRGQEKKNERKIKEGNLSLFETTQARARKKYSEEGEGQQLHAQ